MNITLMLTTDVPEVLWNAFRMANMLLEQDHEVRIFLNGPSVNYASLSSEAFPLAELARIFTLSEGILMACGKMLDLHGVTDGFHQRATQKDLIDLITGSDRFVSF